MLEGKRIAAVVPAAGQGRRMGNGVAKQLLEVNRKPLVIHTLERLSGIAEIDTIVVAAAEDQRLVLERLIHEYRIGKIEAVVIGGKERQDSVWSGLRQLSGGGVDIVLVHDAVRPFVTRDLVLRVCRSALSSGAAIPAVKPRDTIKTLNGDGFVTSTLARDELVLAQTPQAFRFSLIFESHQKAMAEKFYGTDDASLVERYGGRVGTVEGNPNNIKVTTPEDLVIARFLAH